jgi:hypothetical protein
MMNQYYRCYDETKRWFYPFILPFKILKFLLRELRFDVYLLSGKTNMFYITSSEITPYFIERICKDGSITKIKKIYAWELRRYIVQQEAVLIDMHKLFEHFFNNDFLVPPYVRQVLDLDKPVDELIKENRDFKKFSKYRCEVLTDLNALKFFYEKMYFPYIKKRYGDSAVIQSFNYFEKKFLKKGELVFIKLNDEYVSAALCEMSNKVYFFKKVGVLNESLVKEGALSATYYFAILRAKEKNAKYIDFGLSRPFLSDGVLRHKRKWGTQICEDKKINRIFYMKNTFKQPFICIKNKKLTAVVFSKNDNFIKEYAMSGLEFKIAYLSGALGRIF